MANIKRIGVRVPPTASELEAQAAVSETLLNGARKVEAKLTEPDDDWQPIWLVLTPAQGTVLTPETLRNDAEKDRMVRTVAEFARRVGATAIGHLHSSWHVPPTKVSPERLDEIQAHMERFGTTEGVPEREEGLLIAVYTATTYRTVIVPIVRHENAPPTLGELELMFSSSDEDAKLEGRMVDPLRAALRRYG